MPRSKAHDSFLNACFLLLPKLHVTQEAIAEVATKSQTGARSVLVVEDNSVNRRVAQRLLERLGCTVEMAVDGMDALKKSKEKAFDLIFMDCQMPDLDGYQATQSIRDGQDLNNETPIVALTAHALSEDKQRCLDAGMNDYVTKPVSMDDLRRTLERWCQRSQPTTGSKI